jgi:general stress protein 26
MFDKNKVLAVLKNNNCSVISTADLSGKSESAVMVHVYKDDMSLIMCTAPETRKLKNISVNNKVSVVIGGFNNDPSVQMDGEVRILSEEEKVEVMAFVLNQKPEMKDYGIEEETFIIITPTWVRYIDYSQEPNTEEISL